MYVLYLKNKHLTRFRYITLHYVTLRTTVQFNAWVGLWVAFYMVIAAFIDLNRFIKYATRFTHEIFAFLIVSIYILDAVGNRKFG